MAMTFSFSQLYNFSLLQIEIECSDSVPPIRLLPGQVLPSSSSEPFELMNYSAKKVPIKINVSIIRSNTVC